MPAIPIPYAILRGVLIARPRAVSELKIHIIIGVREMTKNGFTACHISGAMVSVRTKSRAKNDND